MSGEGGPDLSVVVVTWNVREYVLRCLTSVAEHAGPIAVEAVVVDNASSDGTLGAVRERFPDAEVIANDANLGFPRACNQGVARSTGRHVLFLNPDAEVAAGTLPGCVSVLDEAPDVGVVGCRIEYPDGRLQPECARRDYRLRHLLYEAFWLHVLFRGSRVFGDQRMTWWDHRGRRDVEAVSGSFLMARREALEGVGGMPEELFMYHEDQSLCLRVRRAGWRVRYLGDLTAVHHAGKATPERSAAELPVLKGEVKVLLVREKQGPAAAAAGRAVWFVRSLDRCVAAAVGRLLPLPDAWRRRLARLLDLRDHWWNLVWSVAPPLARLRKGATEPPTAAGPDGGLA